MRYRFLRFPEGKSKAVTFSYDDGCRSDMRLAQLFSQYGLKATFNICSGLMGISEDGWHLTPDQIQKYILDPGHEVAIHGAHHRAPGKTRPVEGITDVLSCRTELENTFGRLRLWTSFFPNEWDFPGGSLVKNPPVTEWV